MCIPITRRIAGEHLIGERDRTGFGVATKLKFGVGKHQPVLQRNLRTGAVEPQRQLSQRARIRLADQLDHTLEADVFIVLTLRRLVGRCENRLGQPVAIAQSLG